MILTLLEQLAEGNRHHYSVFPDPELLADVLREVMRGNVPPTQLAALLMGLRCRAERAEHLKAVVDVMLENAVPLPGSNDPRVVFDTCGTGGDQLSTVNISTAAALLAASAGIRVAKHGNRAVSSKCGSAEVLETLGLKIDLEPSASAQLLDELNFCFLFAQKYHPAMKHAGPVRRELRFRTIFNLAGPLSNPARPTHQLVGVARRELLSPMIETLRLLGRRRALVVHGRNGEDEISLTTVTEGFHLKADGTVEDFYLDPMELGLKVVEMADLVVADATESAAKLERVMAGEPGPVADVINLNLAAVLFLAERAPNMKQAFNAAREIQQSGSGARLLAELRRLSTELAR
ncbi:anthranilate phosphoribosyltransferase [bacterium]|nr:anthranilate phosphoribosyltransferase [bacterium]